ncbi:polysaccharide biosynthesis protein [Halomonas saccharevitans]|uniref:NDP-sugar epimerase, includes UDP-GlcNAc-inverting 4,6-dehydratase FlaA1 and capsular polysaccharide biosynthesis protein EpsC n=1 Tax=Halomonas saccharevitans TaxID=416872 RepID=A0A1I7CJZ6_9GAMM|nr:nucleoside-diphosphate sugar epimerase/dehydratase [Halomonas saccharevitans]SFT99747.1 NDP-sugar epimerase, includes UDP-GlcNAc-inverting 4,6-dehydratase FlaA1 and capsular polysaccharide biosynthesis protein EpsC [Halomonas saccharevitans]
MPPVLSMLFGLSRTTKRIMEVVADVVLIVASFLGAMWLRLDNFDFLSHFGVWLALPIVVPISIALFAWLGFYRAIIRHLGLKTTQTILIGVVASSSVLGVTALLFDLPIPSSIPFLYAMLALLTVGGVRFGLRYFYLREQQQHKKRVLIYGAGAAGRQLAMSLRHGREYEPVAFLDFAPRLQGSHVQGLKVYPPEECGRIIKAYGVQMFLLAIPGATRARRQEIIESVETMKIPVQTVPDMADVVSGKAKVTELRDVAIEDLLGRDPIPPDQSLMGADITGKVVMVTGAGGSIGSELSRQIFRQHPRQLLLVDVSEYSLYLIEKDIEQLKLGEGGQVSCLPILASVRDGGRLEALMRMFSVDTIYHAAAYKHVPLVEQNMAEGIRNNVFGTLAMAKAAVSARVGRVVLISTDKAVRPTNVMGATKRMAELVCQALAKQQSGTCFSMVRFGNVLGSSGSVVPLFRKQIERGGPLTVTHPDITRYFMTIPEAAQLVIQAGAMSRGGDVFILDMGQPIKIVELAHRMIRLSGLQPYFLDASAPNDDTRLSTPSASPCRKGDIAIEFTGLRPGEKLYEELLIAEAAEYTTHPRIMTANETMLDWESLQPSLKALGRACQQQDMDQVRKILLSIPVGYVPGHELVDIGWLQKVPCGQATEQTAKTESPRPIEALQSTADVIPSWAGLQAPGT